MISFQHLRIVFSAVIFLFCFGVAQTDKTGLYWIILRTPKPTISNVQSSNAASSLGISERALERRVKSLPPDRLIDDLDFPISESILSQIKQTGVKIRVVSRWFNAVSVEASSLQLQLLSTLPMVLRSEPVIVFKHPPIRPSLLPLSPFGKSSNVNGLDYGPSATQLTNMKIVDLQAIGVTGKGVLMGLLDDGFNNYRTHSALKNIHVVATYDFIHNIEDVSIQPWENTTSPDQGNHGAGVLSAVGGFDNGQMIGAAFGASFLLAKTEMDSSGNSADFNSEEDTYVAGLEWAERLGADITSSSLGYKEFLSTPTYSTSDMNGRTTKVARAAVIAARKGVLVVTAMGNEGDMPMGLHRDSTLVSPADADSIIAVGSTSSDGELAVDSGTGPTADGRIKPDVVAQGMGVFWADGSTTTGYQYASGTSCATPLVAGAAALILSAHPQLTNIQVRQALLNMATPSAFKTSQNAVYPNNYYGYGIVDAYDAAISVGPVFSNEPLIVKTNNGYTVTIMLVSKYVLYSDSIFYYYRYDDTSLYTRALLVSTSNPHEYSTVSPLPLNDSLPRGYFSAREETGNISNVPEQFLLFQNYPNPFNNRTIIRFDSPTNDEAEVAIFNLLGQRVKTIFHGPAHQGINLLSFDGVDGSGHPITSGVYFARLKTPYSSRSIKMLYLK